jgi:hypothetical protein
MANTDKAFRQDSWYNPLFCFGKQVEEIVIFDNQLGVEVARHHIGWLAPQGTSNNPDLTVFDNIEFVNKRKVNLEADYSFIVKNTLYINTADLPEFVDLGEQVVQSGAYSLQYGHVVTFVSGDRFDPTPRTMKFITGYYTRYERTEYGKKLDELMSVLAIANIKISDYDADKLLKNKEQLLAVLS